jgi:hypothetical protein
MRIQASGLKQAPDMLFIEVVSGHENARSKGGFSFFDEGSSGRLIIVKVLVLA